MILDNACAKIRRVKNCGECCRFQNCRDNIPYEPVSEQGCLRIGYAIIGGVLEEYEKAYKKGKKNTCLSLEKWLRGEMPWVLSAENYDGNALIDSLQALCYKRYGSLDTIYQKKCDKVREKIALVKEEIEQCNSEKQKGKLRYRIQQLRGLMNE